MNSNFLGNHRPLWAAFGEYRYLPTPRWVHALEHGAATFLYHPCADPVGIEIMKMMAKSCIRKHLITPYRNMKQQFAIITYGCRLMMNYFDPEEAHNYLRKHALVDAPEKTPKNGLFVVELVDGADVVPGSDIHDKCICPYWSSLRHSLEAYMSWYKELENIIEDNKNREHKVTIKLGLDVDIYKDKHNTEAPPGCPLS